MPDPFPWETAPAPADAPRVTFAEGVDLHAGDEQLEEVIRGQVEKRHAFIERAAVADILDGYSGNHGARAGIVGKSTDAVLEAVRARSDARRDARLTRLNGEPVESVSDLRREIVGAADDAETLEAFAGIFMAGAKEAKGMAGDLLGELPLRRGKPPRSAKVGDGDGFELSVSATPRTELKVDADEVVEIMIAALVSAATIATKADPAGGPLALTTMPVKVYAAGAREAVDMLRELLSSTPSFRSTAIDALVKVLENREDDELAKRLRKAYGRVEVGEPSVKLERKPLEPTEESTS